MKYFKGLYIILISVICETGCAKLDQEVYSVTPNQNFWQTPDQIAAGIARSEERRVGKECRL